jgi:hypothetical protein
MAETITPMPEMLTSAKGRNCRKRHSERYGDAGHAAVPARGGAAAGVRGISGRAGRLRKPCAYRGDVVAGRWIPQDYAGQRWDNASPTPASRPSARPTTRLTHEFTPAPAAAVSARNSADTTATPHRGTRGPTMGLLFLLAGRERGTPPGGVVSGGVLVGCRRPTSASRRVVARSDEWGGARGCPDADGVFNGGCSAAIPGRFCDVDDVYLLVGGSGRRHPVCAAAPKIVGPIDSNLRSFFGRGSVVQSVSLGWFGCGRGR